MAQFMRIGTEDFADVWKIMEASFPPNERRTKEKQEELLTKEKKYELFAAKQEERLLAFLAVWHFEKFTFVEHFAVDKNARNGGLGAAMLQELKKKTPQKIILEVEPPEDEMKERRIAFYKRNGFSYNSYPYMQPAMNEDTEAIPLKIMSTEGELDEDGFLEVKDVLYTQLYKIHA